MSKPAHTPDGPRASAVPSAGLLQRTCACGRSRGPTGECAACRRKRRLQAKLRVGPAGDRYEREADRAAAAVVRGVSPSAPLAITPLVQRAGGAEMRAAPPVMDRALTAPGRPLDGGTRAAMEAGFGQDFSGVRVHTGGVAAESAAAVGARAYTVGRDVVFGAGAYRPGTSEGRRLLAHELAHVAQQQTAASGTVQRSVVDCGEDEPFIERSLANSLDAARRTADAISVLSFSRHTMAPTARRRRSPGAEAALVRYFGPSALQHSGDIAASLRRIAAGLGGATVECESARESDYSETCPPNRGGFVNTSVFSDRHIHLCLPKVFEFSSLGRALVHEGAHLYLGASDHGSAYYSWDCQETSTMHGLSDEARRSHADSYACLVEALAPPRVVLEMGTLTFEDDSEEAP